MSLIIPISSLNIESVVSSQDLLPIVNSASLTTYKIPVQEFGQWMSNSGSTSSSFSSTTASFDNFTKFSTSSSFASKSYFNNSASWASQSINSQFAISSSMAHIGNSISSSFANTTKFSTSSSWVSKSTNSISTSFAPTPISASWSFTSISSSYTSTTSVGISLTTAASFPVTASWSNNTVAAKSTITFFPVPISIATGALPISITQYTGSLIPSDASGVILQAQVFSTNTNAQGFIYISSDNGVGSNKKILVGYASAGGGDACEFARQGFFSVLNGISNSTFWYQVTQFTESWEIDIIGYF